MDIEPTASAIESIADRLNDAAIEIHGIAEQMREHNDIACASEAMSAVLNAIGNLRLDLLVTRPIREFQREQKRKDEHGND
jgi:hypothetical protein